MQQLKLGDVTFFKKSAAGQLHQLSCQADDALILSGDSATIKLDNQKNGWKVIFIHQEANGEESLCR
jgi:hypothetical protein